MSNCQRNETILCLFDVDGTLTPARQCISKEIEEMLKKLKTVVKVGVVGGSDLSKINEQIGTNMDVIRFMDCVFAENGLVAYKDGELIAKQNMVIALGEELVQRVINFCLQYMSQLHLPTKRGTFIEFRTGMINVCPVGRSCSYDERLEFNKYDQEHNIRGQFVEALQHEFAGCGLEFVIGGQISIDIYPSGWDKTFCLSFLESQFDTIHFFGDKTSKGGNDYTIYNDPRTVGHSVANPDETKHLVRELFLNSIK